VEQRTLGRTGLSVSVLGLGGLFLSSPRVAGHDRDEARRAVHRAIELGVNYIDTAPSYGDSEAMLGYALAGAPGPCFVATKLGGRPKRFRPQDQEALRRSVHTSLRLLKRDHLDVLLIHEPDRPGQYDWWRDKERFEGPVNEVLDGLKREGLVRFTGLGGTTAYELPHVLATGRYDVVLTAFNYNLLWREAAIAVLPEAKRQGMGVVAGSPLQQGALARRYDEEIRAGPRWLSPPRREQYRRLYALVDEAGIPLPELGLRFVLTNPEVHLVLSGVRSAEEVEANVRAVEKGPLPAEVLTRLQAIADLVPFRPCEEPFSLPFGRAYSGPGRAGR
jgi:aryl-alcohol dehydrogenase-like predicted oxidoreductase